MKSKRSGGSVPGMGRLRLVKKKTELNTNSTGLQNKSGEYTSYIKEIIADCKSREVNRSIYAEFIHSYVDHLNNCNKNSQRVMTLYRTDKE